MDMNIPVKATDTHTYNHLHTLEQKMITEVISWELNPIMHIQTKPSHLCRPLKKSKACQECRSSRHSRPNRSPNNSKHGIKWNNQIAETMQHETHEKDGRLMRWLWKYRYRGSWLSRAMSIEKKQFCRYVGMISPDITISNHHLRWAVDGKRFTGPLQL